MVINLTSQSRIYFGTGFNPQENKKHTAAFLLEGLQQIFDGTLIDEASQVVMRQNDPDLKKISFHPVEVLPAEGDTPAVLPTRPPTVVFVVKWVKILYVVLNMCIAAPDLKTIVRQYRSEKDGRAALLHVLMAAETEYFGLKDFTLVLKTMTTQVCVGKVDLTAVFDRIKEQWDRYNRMKPKKPLDTTTVAA